MKTSVLLCFSVVSGVFLRCFLLLVVVIVYVPKTQIPKHCVSAVANNNNTKILINYSCLFGPYTSLCKNVRLMLHLQMKLFAIPVESFSKLFIFLPLHYSQEVLFLILFTQKAIFYQCEQISYFVFANSNFVI